MLLKKIAKLREHAETIKATAFLPASTREGLVLAIDIITDIEADVKARDELRGEQNVELAGAIAATQANVQTLAGMVASLQQQMQGAAFNAVMAHGTRGRI